VSRRTSVLPLADLVDAEPTALRADLVPALVVAATSVPQGLAWAVVAGLPPVLGLWAATVPTVVAALARSSRTTIVGPTNAVSVLIAASAVAGAEDPVAAAGTLALLVGALQLAIGAASLTSLVRYVSGAVVTGLVTGAATLMIVGALPDATGTVSVRADIATRAVGWLANLDHADPVAVGFAGASVAAILALRRRLPRGVPMLLVTLAATSLAAALGLDRAGLRTLGTGGVPVGLPPFGLPSLADAVDLLPVAVTAAVLSLVETHAVDQAAAERTGQLPDERADALGLGLANVAASLFGGYPVSGSLARSAVVVRMGAGTRLVGVWAAAVLLLALPLLGPVVAHVPLPVVAAVVLVAAADLVRVDRIRTWLTGSAGDRLAFVGTVAATWLLPFDQAVGVGLGLSVALFLRRAHLLVVRELWVGADGRLREVDADHPPTTTAEHPGRCKAVPVLSVDGPLFFGSAGELLDTLLPFVDDDEVRAVVVRPKRSTGLDASTAGALRHVHSLLARTGRQLVLVGPAPKVGDDEERALTADFGAVPTERPRWFPAMTPALAHALAAAGPTGTAAHRCGPHCPLAAYVAAPPG
jgi:SulP family sulfate permease